MTKIYEDGEYLENNPSWHEEDSPWKARQIIKMIEKNGLNPTRICEIGCGAGEILCQLSEHFTGKEYFGYEISPQAFELCEKKTASNRTFFHRDLFEEKDARFDLVMAIDVFEHVEDCFGFLRNLKETAEYKIFHIPLDLSVQSVLRSSPIIKSRRTVGHIHYFSKETALETLTDTGYEIVDHFYTNGTLELPNRGWKANLLKIPRKMAFAVSKDHAVRILGGFSLLVLAK
ncbi:MAG: methyltransferase domain-containing protein [Planctomycetes bacterium]|nr:methyltransferase domain-containing protein [Planctomycetota bacterium]